MMAFFPHTDKNIRDMLATLGLNSIESLFDEIPQNLKINGFDNIPTQLSEMELNRLMQARGEKNHRGLCFIGAGAYEHHIPAAVWDITSRGEYYTAYTPYQAEASQGTLQLLYEFQTMMASLCGMDVANASLYDGASGTAEAVLMALRCNKKNKSRKVLSIGALNPRYRNTIKSIVGLQNIELKCLPYNPEAGKTLANKIKHDDFAALIIQQPNYFGSLEEIDQLCDFAHQHNALVIAVVNPTSLGLLKEPGQWGTNGADIVCGEGQPLGIPLASGGPYFGFLCAKQEFIRQMPGRIVGRTIDQNGDPGFTLTLQAREQHIRRSKARSNICTNQGLLVTAATIYMSLLGPQGLKQVATRSHQNTKLLVESLTQISGVKKKFNSPFFHECVIQLKRPVEQVLSQLYEKEIQGGYYLEYDFPELGDCMLVCATETKNKQDINYYQQQLTEVLA